MLSRLVLALAAFVTAASGDIVTSNLHVPSGTGTAFGAGSTTVYKAAAFTLPTTDRRAVQSVTLTMDFTGGGTPQVSIWSGNGSTPATQLVVLNNPPLGGLADYTFTIPSTQSLILLPGQKYWVRVASTNPAASFSWSGTNPSADPVGLATFNGFVFNDAASTTRNKLLINLRPVFIDNISGTVADDIGTNATTTKDFGYVNRSSQDYNYAGFLISMDGLTGGSPEMSVHRGGFDSPDSPALVTHTFSPIVGPRELAGTNPFFALQAPGETFWLRRTVDDADLPWRWFQSDPLQQPGGANADSRGYLFNGASSNTTNRLAMFANPVISHAKDTSPASGSFMNSTEIKAVSFTLPQGRGARVQFLRIDLDRTTNPGIVQLWRGGAQPQALLGTFEDPVVIRTTADGEDLQFRLRTPVALAGPNTYWITVQGAVGAGEVVWLATNEPVTTARGLGIGGAWLFSTNSGVTWDPSTVRNSFAVIGPGSNSCPADLSTSSDPLDPSYGVPDGVVDASDFFYYLDQFAIPSAAIADLTASSDPSSADYGVRDGVVDASDFFYYLDRFAEGCD